MVTAEVIAPTNRQFEDAVAKQDAAGCAAVYTPDASILPPNGPRMSGRAAIEAFWQGILDAGLRDARLETVSLEMHGDTAIELGTYVLNIAAPTGSPVEDRGKFVVIWKRDIDGVWRWAVDIFNSDLSAAG
jgi:uncharacterized protein (TIGR02246 family)